MSSLGLTEVVLILAGGAILAGGLAALVVWANSSKRKDPR